MINWLLYQMCLVLSLGYPEKMFFNISPLFFCATKIVVSFELEEVIIEKNP